MKMRFLEYWERVTQWGVHKDLSFDDRVRVPVHNTICMLAIIVVLFVNVLFISLGVYVVMYLLIIIPIACLVLLLNANRWFKSSRFILIYGLMFAILVSSLLIRRAGIEFLLIAVGCTTTYAFNSWRHVTAAFLISLCCHLFYSWFDRAYTFVPVPRLPYFFANYLSLGFGAFIVAANLGLSRFKVQSFTMKLEEAASELENKVEQRTKELRVANEAKDHFLGMATHDLKSPINRVLGIIELMRLENKDRPVTDQEYLQYMKNVCMGMVQLISNLLDVNQIEQGGMVIQKQKVELKKLMATLKSGFARQAEQKNIELKVTSFDGDIHTDEDALARILENLVSNAIKFSAKGTTIEVRTIEGPGVITFEIIDQGPGISQEDMPKLFGKFQRLGHLPTAGESSTGLGLAIVKELTLLLGGEITVTSEIGKGTTFTLFLPYSSRNLLYEDVGRSPSLLN
jgi:signal transduction histidine kinase